MPIAAKNGF